MSEALRSELLAVEGIAEAAIDDALEGPVVRVRLIEGADRLVVAEGVQHVLARHGIRSRVAPPRTDPEQPPLRGPAPDQTPAAPQPQPPESLVVRSLGEVAPARSGIPADRLGGVSLIPLRTGIRVEVTTASGHVGSAVAKRSAKSVRRALTAAIADARGIEDVRLVGIERKSVAGRRSILAVVRVGEQTAVGSSIVAGSSTLAAAAAIWQATASALDSLAAEEA